LKLRSATLLFVILMPPPLRQKDLGVLSRAGA